MSKAVGVIVEDEVIEWHAPHHGVGDYDTLCGLDANDSGIGTLGMVEPKARQKITCQTCKSIWQGTRALRLHWTNFA